MALSKGSKGDDVRRLQNGLTFLGYPAGAADGDYGRSTENAVAAFQKKQKLFVDGKAGDVTLSAYNAALAPLGASGEPYTVKVNPVISLAPVAAPTGTLLKWVKSKADKVPGRDGYANMVLREDIAADYQKLLDAVHSCGGVLTSSGGRRDLESESGPNRSMKSLHYLGRAFDMSLDTGMVDPATDSFVIERPNPNSRLWKVWGRSSFTPSGPGLVQQVTVDGWYMNIGKDAKGKTLKQPATKTVTFNGFDFTDLAFGFGFTPIQARPGFFQGDLLGAEWWHFQNMKGLTSGITFGSELLRVYSPEDAAKFVYWNDVKDARFGSDWG